MRKSIYRSFGKLKETKGNSSVEDIHEDKMGKTTTVDISSNSVVTMIIDYTKQGQHFNCHGS